jgi:NADH-quinone oxidoreductase subunit N
MESSQLIVASPVLISVATVLVLLVADMFSRRVAIILGILGLVKASGFAVWAVFGVSEVTAVQDVFIGGKGYSSVAAIVCALGALTLLGGWHWYAESARGGPAAALVVMVAAGSAALAGTIDLVMLLIIFATLSVSGYALVAQPGTPRASEASVKYVVQGSVATGLLVLGLAVLLGLNGTTSNILFLSEALATEYASPVMFAAGMLAAAYAFKLGAFPFHSWTPDSYEAAPPASSAILASAPKLATVLSLLLVFGVTFGGKGYIMGTAADPVLPLAWGVIAAASILFGNLVALRQSSYLRMLGYSGIAQIGYALVAVTVSAAAPAQAVFQAAAVLVSAYAIAVLGAFMLGEAVRRRRPEWDGSIRGLAGLGTTDIALGLGGAVIMFSLTGIPLTAGFWGKLQVFGLAVQVGYEWLAVIGVLGSVISFGYYGSVLRSMYFDDAPAVESDAPAPRARAATFVVLLVAAVLVVAGVLPLIIGLEPLLRFFAF